MPNAKGLESGAVLAVLVVQLPAVQSSACVIAADRTVRLCLSVLSAARHLPGALRLAVNIFSEASSRVNPPLRDADLSVPSVACKRVQAASSAEHA